MQFVATIPNINNIFPNWLGKIQVYYDKENDLYVVKADTAGHQSEYKVTNPNDIKAINNYLADNSKKENFSTKSSFEQFHDILQTALLATLAGGSIYYFFFYNKKGKR